MRILVVSQYWHPDNGIPQHRWAWLTRVLEDAGHAVDVVCPHPTSGDEAVGHETLYFTHLFKPGSGLTRRALIQVASAVDAVRTGISGPEKPDVVIGTVPAIPTALSTLALAKARGGCRTSSTCGVRGPICSITPTAGTSRWHRRRR